MDKKEDWEQARERIAAWWHGEIIDRVAVQVYAPADGEKPFDENDYPSPQRFTDPETVSLLNRQRIQRTFFGGEAYPFYYSFLCPSTPAAYLGCGISFAGGTAWLGECISSILDFDKVVFDRSNIWYKTMNAMLERAVSEYHGQYVVTLGDLGSSAEILAYMLGAQNLCYDIVDYPEEVKKARDKILSLWLQLYDEMYNALKAVQEGSCQWLMAWSEGKTYPLQCDFAAMLSPRQFEEFFLPEIIAQCRFLDDPIFHVDGKEMLQHLDLLLDIPELKAIQWCPGASAGENKSMLQWVPVLKRIQAKGKSIHIEIAKNEIEPLLRELSPRGLMLNTRCDSESEAKELLRCCEQWTCRR